MATTSKKTTSKTASATTAKKTIAKKIVAAIPPVKKPAAKAKAAVKTVTPVKKASVIKPQKPLPAPSGAAKTKAPAARKNAPGKSAPKTTVSPEERYRMIEAAAYLRAEKRNFSIGHALDDWIAAEAEIDAMLKA